ncbi:MAG TPA: class F sortase [Candidatus Saccharimonadales bacterium]|nr:class F sortase [Candidatus Saccharimonadales bacterium]
MHAQPFNIPTSTWRQVLLAAAAYYAAARARLVRRPAFPQVRRIVSAGLTATLFMMSASGFYYAWSMYWPGDSNMTPITQASAGAAAVAAPTTHSLPRSAPTTVAIPAIGLSSSLVGVGRNNDGSLAVPDGDTAGWYAYAPTPGEIGPAILVGHVDDLSGPAVFANLKELKPGDSVEVMREDGRRVDFTVTKTAAYAAENFATEEVYGNIDHAGLRLITCSGEFNHLTRQYSHNLVVYAKAKL